MTGTATILRADARALPLPDGSVDAIVCDPPYSLSFMGREWDSHESPAAFQAWCLVWAREAYRVLKPGGHMLAFGGSRTWHRLVCAIEDAGFEIRDSMAWLYGSGFPKSLDVSKAIDKGRRRDYVLAAVELGLSIPGNNLHDWTKAEHSPSDAWWERFKAHLPAEDWQRIERAVTGRWESPGRGSRSAEQRYGLVNDSGDITAPATDDARLWQGWGTALKPGFEPIVVARKPLAGTVAANILQFGTGALNIDACRVDGGERPNRISLGDRDPVDTYGKGLHGSRSEGTTTAGRWPTNVVLSHAPLLDELGDIIGDACADGCVPGCPVAELDAQTGTLKSGANPTRRGSDKVREAYGDFKGQAECTPARGADEGGASRFFPTFRYEAKAPDHERPRVNGVAHPTVKPLELIRWLCRLVTQPGGRVLDMFGGSGTTAEAALLEGFDVVVSENWEPYLPLIQYRADRARRRRQPGVARLVKAKPAAQADGQGDLFADLIDGAA